MTPRETIHAALEAIADRYGVSLEDAMSKSRKRPLPQARWHMWLYLRRRNWSYQRIGDYVGGADHSTVMAGIAKAKKEEEACATLFCLIFGFSPTNRGVQGSVIVNMRQKAANKSAAQLSEAA